MIKTFNKSVFIWMIVILAAINISILGTIVYHVYFQNDTVQEYNSAKVDLPEGRLGRMFKEELNLSAGQHRQFRAFRQNYHKQANELTRKMRMKRHEMITELGNEHSDTTNLHKLSVEIGDLHAKLKELTFEYYLQMKSICSDEQKVKLFQIFETMISQDAEIQIPVRK